MANDSSQKDSCPPPPPPPPPFIFDNISYSLCNKFYDTEFDKTKICFYNDMYNSVQI